MAFIIAYIVIFILIAIYGLILLIKKINFDYSIFAKNPKMKIFLQDRFHFFKVTEELNTNRIYFVFGKTEGGSTPKPPPGPNVFFEPFQIVNSSDASYIVVDPSICSFEEENYQFINLRLKVLFERFAKKFPNHLVDGAIFIVKNAPKAADDKSPKPLTSNPVLCGKMIDAMQNTFNAFVSVHFLLDEFAPQELVVDFDAQFNDELSFGGLGVINQGTLEGKYSDQTLSDICTGFVDSLESQLRQRILSSISGSTAIFSLSGFNLYLKKHLFDFKNSFLNAFFQAASGSGHSPILRSILFTHTSSGSDNFSLENALTFIGKDAGIGFYREEEKYKRKLSLIIASSVSALHAVLVTTALIIGISFLSQQTDKIKISLEKLNQFLNVGKKDIKVNAATRNKNETTKNQTLETIKKSSEELDEKGFGIGCGLLSEAIIVRQTTLNHSLLVPSYFSNPTQIFFSEYANIIGLSLAKVFIKKFNMYVAGEIEKPGMSSGSQLFTPEVSEQEESLKKYLSSLSDIDKSYKLIMSDDVIDNANALDMITRITYKRACASPFLFAEIIREIDRKKINSDIKPNKDDLKIQAISKLQILIENFLASIVASNQILQAAERFIKDLEHVGLFLNNENAKIPEKNLAKNLALQDNDSKNTLDLFDYVSYLMKSYNELNQKLNDYGQTVAVFNEFTGPGFVSIGKKINEISVLGKAQEDKIKEFAKNEFQRFRTSLSSLKPTYYALPFFTFDEKGFARPEANFAALFNNINLMRNTVNAEQLKFTSEETFITWVASLPRAYFWDSERIKQDVLPAMEFAKVYDANDPKKYTNDINNFYNKYSQKLILAYWAKTLPSTINLMQVTSTQPSDGETNPSEKETKLLLSSANQIKFIIDQLQKHGLQQSLVFLKSSISQRIFDNLNQIYIRLDRSSAYRSISADLSTWAGDVSPTSKAYLVSTDEDLKAYFEKIRLEIKNTADSYTIPLVNFYEGINPQKDSDFTPVRRWKIIQSSLENQTQFSSLYKINDFILNKVAKVRAQTCLQYLSIAAPTVDLDDFFSQRHFYIYNLVANRCKEIYREKAINSYNKVASLFNNLLSGRFPFKAREQKVDSVGADATNIYQVISEFSTFMREDYGFLNSQVSSFSNDESIKYFIKNMAQVTEFFRFQKNKDGVITPQDWIVNFSFRIDRSLEILANQIIDWSISNGKNLVGSRYGSLSSSSFLWKYKTPLAFTTTIANSSKYVPLTSAKGMPMRIEGRNIVFPVDNIWSILKFISTYAQCDKAKGCDYSTLEFVIPVNDKENIRFFCGITLEIPESKKRVTFPEFPLVAPYYNDKIVEEKTSVSLKDP